MDGCTTNKVNVATTVQFGDPKVVLVAAPSHGLRGGDHVVGQTRSFAT